MFPDAADQDYEDYGEEFDSDYSEESFPGKVDDNGNLISVHGDRRKRSSRPGVPAGNGDRRKRSVMPSTLDVTVDRRKSSFRPGAPIVTNERVPSAGSAGPGDRKKRYVMPGTLAVAGDRRKGSVMPGTLAAAGDRRKGSVMPGTLAVAGDRRKSSVMPGTLAVAGDRRKSTVMPGTLDVAGDRRKSSVMPGTLAVAGDRRKSSVMPGTLGVNQDRRKSSVRPGTLGVNQDRRKSSIMPGTLGVNQDRRKSSVRPGTLGVNQDRRKSSVMPGTLGVNQDRRKSSVRPGTLGVNQDRRKSSVRPGTLGVNNDRRKSSVRPGSLSVNHDRRKSSFRPGTLNRDRRSFFARPGSPSGADDRRKRSVRPNSMASNNARRESWRNENNSASNTNANATYRPISVQGFAPSPEVLAEIHRDKSTSGHSRGDLARVFRHPDSIRSVDVGLDQAVAVYSDGDVRSEEDDQSERSSDCVVWQNGPLKSHPASCSEPSSDDKNCYALTVPMATSMSLNVSPFINGASSINPWGQVRRKLDGETASSREGVPPVTTCLPGNNAITRRSANTRHDADTRHSEFTTAGHRQTYTNSSRAIGAIVGTGHATASNRCLPAETNCRRLLPAEDRRCGTHVTSSSHDRASRDRVDLRAVFPLERFDAVDVDEVDVHEIFKRMVGPVESRPSDKNHAIPDAHGQDDVDLASILLATGSRDDRF